MGRKKKVEEAETKRNTPRVSLDNTASKMGQMEKPADLVMLDAPMKKTSMEQITGAKKTDGLAGRTIFNPIQTVTPNAKVTAAKAEVTTPPTASTFSDMLAQRRNELRKTAEQDKTDAVKMQKYYALTDALGALGKMGGAAIGGAIGGGMGDSAPIVADYQPSRGYVEAFEKAKQANERLRALDEQDFQLTYAKQQRDEEREYKAKTDALDKKYQKEMIEYKAQLDQAIAQGNMELKAKLESAIAAKQHEYNVEVAKVKGEYALKEKNLGLKISQEQANEYNRTPVRTKGGQIVNVPNNTMKSIEASLIGETVNGVKVTKDNVAQVIMKNADEILPQWGIEVPAATSTAAAATQTATTPAQAVANSAFIEAQHTEPSVPKKEEKKEDESTKEEIEGVYWD